jgi:osmotically-inducible protein OsmY
MTMASARPRLAAANQPVLDGVRQQLQSSPFYAIRALRCDFHEGVVTLRGSLPSYYLRQIAQSLVRRVSGVLELDDRITVTDTGFSG